MKVMRHADLTPTSWKNGGGVTRQIAVFPPEAGQGEFHWRVSAATVGSDGPFSVFPDVDRVLWLLQGDGLELRLADGSRHVLRPGEHLKFRGDEPADARLLGGPVEGLNIMTNRRFATAVAWERRVNGAGRLELRGDRSVVIVRRGNVVASDLPGAPPLAERDGLVVDGPQRAVDLSGQADLVVVRFDHLDPGGADAG